MINLKNDNKEIKTYILIFCAIVLYAILITIKNIPLTLMGIDDSKAYNIICQFFAIEVLVYSFLVGEKNLMKKYLSK